MIFLVFAKTTPNIPVITIKYLSLLVVDLPRDRTTPKVIESNNSLTRLCSLKDAILKPGTTNFQFPPVE